MAPHIEYGKDIFDLEFEQDSSKEKSLAKVFRVLSGEKMTDKHGNTIQLKGSSRTMFLDALNKNYQFTTLIKEHGMRKSELRKQIRQMISETPDRVYVNLRGDYMTWRNGGTAFGQIDSKYGTVFGMRRDETHEQLLDTLCNTLFIRAYEDYEKQADSNPDDASIIDTWEEFLDVEDSELGSIRKDNTLSPYALQDYSLVSSAIFGQFSLPDSRSSLKLCGRLWKEQKIISFWHVDDYKVNNVKQALLNLSREGVTIKTSEWKIDLWPFIDEEKYPGLQLVTIDKFFKVGKKIVSKDKIITPSELDVIVQRNKEIEHIVSPLKKQSNWAKMTKKQKKDLYQYYLDKGRPTDAEERFLYMIGTRSGSKKLQKLGESLMKKSELRRIIREMVQEAKGKGLPTPSPKPAPPAPSPKPTPNPAPESNAEVNVSMRSSTSTDSMPSKMFAKGGTNAKAGKVKTSSPNVEINTSAKSGSKAVDVKASKLQTSNMKTDDSFSGKMIAKAKEIGANLDRAKAAIDNVDDYNEDNTED